MIYPTSKRTWRLISNSVVGSSDRPSGKPNQDRITFFPKDKNPENLPIIFAIADGHGGKKYFRSERGANFAVETAIEVCKDQLMNSSWNSIKDKKIKDWLCRDIFRRWTEKVRIDIEDDPFSDEEKALLQTKNLPSTKIPQIINNDYNVFAYGSTLLTVIIHESYVLFLQLGDGDILDINYNGIIDRPIPDDYRLIGNETTSLCLPEAWAEFKFKLCEISLNSPFPALILISTDGYKNSFSEETGFEKVGSNLLSMICEHPDGINAGLDLIDDNLNDWLNVASVKGSGDDITIGIICNIDQIKVYRDTVYPLKKQKRMEELNPQEKSPIYKEETLSHEIPINPDNLANDITEKPSELPDSVIDQL